MKRLYLLSRCISRKNIFTQQGFEPTWTCDRSGAALDRSAIDEPHATQFIHFKLGTVCKKYNTKFYILLESLFHPVKTKTLFIEPLQIKKIYFHLRDSNPSDWQLLTLKWCCLRPLSYSGFIFLVIKYEDYIQEQESSLLFTFEKSSLTDFKLHSPFLPSVYLIIYLSKN